MTARRAFGSTYRLQLNGLGFDAAADLVPFVRDLGIRTLYLSPITRARSGSTHGYDVADPTIIDPELGGAAGFERLVAAATSHGLTLLLDIVPNHMAASLDNPFFADVLRFGKASPYASYFDIAWAEQDDRIALPVLDGPVESVVASGGLRVVGDHTDWQLEYAASHYPLDPSTLDAAPADGPALLALLGRQHYRLIDWRRANQEVNYRRFFDINELIGVRQEDPDVFTATHKLITSLVADPRIAGVRVDHVDGLRDPAGYLTRLRSVLGPDPIIEVEKILERDEALRPWPIDGTSGYEFAVATTGLFLDATGVASFARDASRASGDHRSFEDRALAAKRLVAQTRFHHLVEQVVEELRPALAIVADADLSAAVSEVAIQLAVYRTYRVPGEADDDDLRRFRDAVSRARVMLEPTATAALAAVENAFRDPVNDVANAAVARWQQLTPPLTAKGVEDTAMYEPGQLLAAADVGGHPDHPAMAVADWHTTMAARQSEWPRAMSTLSTHDSKRSQDVRCRLAVLSEIPDQWERAVATIDAMTEGWRTDAGPDVVERRYLYETIVGAWPISGGLTDGFAARIRDHMTKAGREAKRRSDWITPDLDHETAVGGFVDRLLSGDDLRPRALLAGMVHEVERAGAANSLAAVVVRAAAPGIPDVYQGDDAWFFALVDPDNRKPMDVDAHRELLASLTDMVVDELLNHWRDGRLKQHVVARSLQAREHFGELVNAEYVGLETAGERADHVIAFQRSTATRQLLCVVPRLTRSLVGPAAFALGEVWGDTTVAIAAGDGRAIDEVVWTDQLTGASHRPIDGALAISAVLGQLPVALLSAQVR